QPSEDTQALPIARRLSRDTRRLVFFAARARPGDERLFAAAVEATGGGVLAPDGAIRLAAYGLAGMERAAAHAARGALELRHASRIEGVARLDPTPAMVVLAGEGRGPPGSDVEPGADVLARAEALLEQSGRAAGSE